MPQSRRVRIDDRGTVTPATRELGMSSGPFSHAIWSSASVGSLRDRSRWDHFCAGFPGGSLGSNTVRGADVWICRPLPSVALPGTAAGVDSTYAA